MDRLPVLVVSPDPLARAGLAALVRGREDLAPAGEASPGRAASAPGLAAGAAVLWDLGADRRASSADGAPDELAALAGGPSGAAVVALCVDEAQAGSALRAGARGALFRGAEADAVAAALHAAARGLAVLDPELAGAFLRPPPATLDAEPLTPREREVLGLLAEGLANKQIAARLGVSEHTAKFHVNAILGKLGAESRAEAIVRAARAGLVTL